MYGNKLTQDIYKTLNDRGAGLGNASLIIIQQVLDKQLGELQEHLPVLINNADKNWWLDIKSVLLEVQNLLDKEF